MEDAAAIPPPGHCDPQYQAYYSAVCWWLWTGQWGAAEARVLQFVDPGRSPRVPQRVPADGSANSAPFAPVVIRTVTMRRVCVRAPYREWRYGVDELGRTVATLARRRRD